MRYWRARVALPLALILISTASAHAQQAVSGFEESVCEGQISTFPLDTIPADQFYWVDIFDETDEALAFRGTFLATLRADGRKTNRDGRLVFNFESESAFLGLNSRGGIDTAQGNARRERDGNRDVGISELRDTIRESGSSRRNQTALGQQLDAKAELRDAEIGRVVWLATLSCAPLTGDRKLLARFISNVIVDSMDHEGGQTTF